MRNKRYFVCLNFLNKIIIIAMKFGLCNKYVLPLYKLKNYLYEIHIGN